MYFDIYFSDFAGLQIDFPFIQLDISANAIYFLIILVTALRIRKLFTARNRNSVSENIFADDLNEFEIDWTSR